jgi:hypothetical protein
MTPRCVIPVKTGIQSTQLTWLLQIPGRAGNDPRCVIPVKTGIQSTQLTWLLQIPGRAGNDG